MKKLILVILAFLFFISPNINAQSLAGYKICINPGHGGRDSDDRNIPEANFWESESNLAKGLHLKAILESLGAAVYITRTTNNTADDLPLSQIVAFANSRNVDFFHSIHSNATGTSTKANYTLILFQGRNTVPTYAGSLTMANFLGEEIFKSNRTIRKMIAGDFDFYGTGQAYLGVFKGLIMPGTLSEGSFHDYLPEVWRLKNDSYLKNEAWAIARSFLQYFKGGELKTGIAAGILRDELESVPASYLPLSGTKDNFKPVNGAKVTLMPGSKIFTTDNFNNGYYFFDEVIPGNYKLIFEYDKMKTDTLNIIVKANEIVFTDKAMILNPILDPPVITNFTPVNNSTGVSNVTNIVIEFSIRMNTQETEKAISILPSTAGSYKWENDFKRAIFTPAKGYVPGGKYTVSVSTAAKTYFGINLLQQSSFNFTTRSQFNLVSSYPLNNAADISTSVMMRLTFDKGIDGTTLANKISVTDSTGTAVSLQANMSRYNIGIIDFEPKTPLENNSNYTITVKEGIGDVEYVKLLQTITIKFRTEKNYSFTGNLLEGFEAQDVWQSPLLSANTKGVNSASTGFEIYTLKKKSGESSGNLYYTFSGSNGSVELAINNPILIGGSSNSEFGIWVFGDNSYNLIEYRFIRSNEEKVQLDTINWTGWKLKKILLNQIPGTGTIKFKSIILSQSAKGILTGRLLFDDCFGNIITGIKESNELPAEYILEQNYPNPFNPSTKISYQLSAIGHVSLKVYDVLGREVAVLVNEYQQAGSHSVEFRVRPSGPGSKSGEYSSGIYFYQLKVGDFVQTKKMILSK